MSEVSYDESPFDITTAELSSILEQEYGVRASAIDLLNGYDDQNYYVQEEAEGRAFILKVYNEKFSSSTKEIMGEIELLAFLRSRGFPVPDIATSKNGAKFYSHELQTKDKSRQRQRLLRLQVYFPGKILARTEISPDICFSLGWLVGRMNAAMAEILNPTICQAFEKAGVEWDLGHLDKLRQLAVPEFIPDESRKSLARRAIDFADSKIQPHLHSLPKQTIHGDVNEQNVIVTDEGSKIVGIIDFGDSVVTCRVFEPAIAMMYIILFGVDPVRCSSSFLTGYLQSVNLSKTERSLIFPCIVGRFAQSLVIGNYTAHQLALQNKPNGYVLTTSKKGWPILFDLMDSPLGAQLADMFESIN